MRALGLLAVVVGMWACIEGGDPAVADDAGFDGAIDASRDATVDGSWPDVGFVDAEVVVEGCGRWGDPEACAADDCTFRNGRCVDWPSCDGHSVREGVCEAQACRTSADGTCYDPADPARCEDVDTLNCLERQCFWWRAPGQSARCHAEDRPADCDQPDGASCEAAGCEWTGRGCARPQETPCSDLDTVACGGRLDCAVIDMACRVRPDASCPDLTEADCGLRADCGWLGVACVDLDQGPCEMQGEWACGERQDCEPVRADGCDGQPKQQQPDDRAAAPDAGAGGAGGGGGGGGSFEPSCAVPEDCGPGAGCADGICVSCEAFRGCMPRP
ncbi:MAG: hypothetical protein R3F60_00860 [bacterium]